MVSWNLFLGAFCYSVILLRVYFYDRDFKDKDWEINIFNDNKW